MKYLLFPIDGVKKILEHSKTFPVFSPSYAEQFDGRYRKDGQDLPISFDTKVRPDDVDLTKLPPKFCLVHDAGIYLMAETTEPLKGDKTRNFIVHCEGCNPDVDEDYYDTARFLVGGDDFSEHLPLAWLERAVANADKLGIDCMIIGVKEDSFLLIEGVRP